MSKIKTHHVCIIACGALSAAGGFGTSALNAYSTRAFAAPPAETNLGSEEPTSPSSHDMALNAFSISLGSWVWDRKCRSEKEK